jgi:hypothetical protein
MSETFRMFNYLRSKNTSSSLTPHTTYAEILTLTDLKARAENDNPQWKMITLPDEINYYLLLRNQRHFGQAQGTPFTIAPLSDDVDWTASTPELEDILAGAYDTSNLDHLVQAVLKECQYKTTADAITGHVTTEAFLDKFRTWKHTTTTSPSGRHLGLYKALTARLGPKYLDDNKELEAIRASLTQVHVNLINYCLKFRLSQI